MKMTKTITLAALVIGSLWAASSLQAEDAPKGKPPGERGGPGGPGARNGGEMIAKMLELTDDQKPKVKVIMEDMQQQMQSLRTDTSVATPDKAAKAKEIREATNVKLKEVLTAEQFAKLEKMGPGSRKGPPGGAPAGKGKAPKKE